MALMKSWQNAAHMLINLSSERSRNTKLENIGNWYTHYFTAYDVFNTIFQKLQKITREREKIIVSPKTEIISIDFVSDSSCFYTQSVCLCARLECHWIGHE